MDSLARTGDSITDSSTNFLDGPDGLVLVRVVGSIQTMAHNSWKGISNKQAWRNRFIDKSIRALR
jgi:hypothetical protein